MNYKSTITRIVLDEIDDPKETQFTNEKAFRKENGRNEVDIVIVADFVLSIHKKNPEQD
jgi:hypothetical protein